jgi:hypothetical protein
VLFLRCSAVAGTESSRVTGAWAGLAGAPPPAADEVTQYTTTFMCACRTAADQKIRLQDCLTAATEQGLPAVHASDSTHRCFCVCNAVLQVCEQPPVSAAHAENEHFTYDIVSAPATKFQGNSLEVYPKGEIAALCNAEHAMPIVLCQLCYVT